MQVIVQSADARRWAAGAERAGEPRKADAGGPASRPGRERAPLKVPGRRLQVRAHAARCPAALTCSPRSRCAAAAHVQCVFLVFEHVVSSQRSGVEWWVCFALSPPVQTGMPTGVCWCTISAMTVDATSCAVAPVLSSGRP